MFDSGGELLPAGAAQLAGLIEQNHAELKAAECRMLQLACAWADAHYLDSGSDEYQPVIQRACAWGGEGTPEVSEYCAAELGALQGTGIMAARALIADALDLRYRLPRLWDRVLTGGVRAWQARKIAEHTRPLSWEACADVDHALSDLHGGWHKHQPEPGYYLHRSPTGYIYLVTNQGTLALGRTTFSAAVWQASKPEPAAIPS
jgi:Domain of unknown function (DUF222)